MCIGKGKKWDTATHKKKIKVFNVSFFNELLLHIFQRYLIFKASIHYVCAISHKV